MRCLLVCLVACSSPTPSPAAIDAAVDSGSAAQIDATMEGPEVAIIYRTRDGKAVDAAMDAPVPMIFPPQGGFVMLVGARVRGLDPATVTVTASLRDAATTPVLTLEMRPVSLTLGADGWAWPADPDDMFDWANLPTCPLSNTTRNLYDQAYVLRIAATDGAANSSEAKLTIVPTCESGTAGALCRCQCKHGYKLGDPCP
jgi:hypothetical protein